MCFLQWFMGCRWIAYGRPEVVHGGTTWEYGYFMDCPWVAYGRLIRDRPSVPHGCYVGIPWVAHGSLWGAHGFAMVAHG